MHGTCVQFEPVMDSNGEEDLGNNDSMKDFWQDHIDSEYGWLISVLEHCGGHVPTGESTDVLDGVACALLSLDIAHLSEM